MAGTPSTAATFKVAAQAQKGTAASTGFITGMMIRSGLNAQLDKINKQAEHGVTYARASAHKTPTRRGSYIVKGNFRSALYPDLFGLLLTGAGFEVATAGAGTNKTHTFTLADRDDYNWLTALWDLEDNERLAKDCRVTRLVIDGSPDGVFYEGDIAGLSMGEAAGTETTAAEDTDGELLPSEGTLTLKYDPAGANTTVYSTPTSTLARAQLTIANPVNENDRSIHRFGRADLNQTGIDVTSRLEGVVIDYDIYNMIVNGGTAGTSPSPNAAVFSLTYSFLSVIEINTGNPYGLTITIPRMEFDLEDFQADGDSLVTWNTVGRMIDDPALGSTAPITLALVSKKTSY